MCMCFSHTQNRQCEKSSFERPTKFPLGPHLFSAVHRLLEGLPSSQHLISHTSSSYTCVRNAHSSPLFSKGLKAISLLWLDENASLKYTLNSASLILFTRPGDILKWRKFNFLASSNRVEHAGRKIFHISKFTNFFL